MLVTISREDCTKRMNAFKSLVKIVPDLSVLGGHFKM